MASVMMLSLFTGCGAKKPAEDKKSTKPVASTTVKTTKKSDKKDKATEEAASDTTTKVSTSEKTTAKKKGTGKAPSNANHEKKPAPAPAVPTTAAPTKPSNQFGYHNAWNTLSGMEAELKNIALSSEVGFEYYDDTNIRFVSDGGWRAPVSNYEYGNWRDNIIAKLKSSAADGNTVRIFFVTKKDYASKIGSGKKAPVINSDTFLNDDEVLVYVVTGTTFED